MEYRIERKIWNGKGWLHTAGKKAAEFMALLRESAAVSAEEEARACERAELEAETAAMFRETF